MPGGRPRCQRGVALPYSKEPTTAYLRDLAFRFRKQMPAGLMAPDQPKGKITTLQWLGPEMAKHGLLKNEGWVTDHADEADRLFPN